jgi:hypothetical protein
MPVLVEAGDRSTDGVWTRVDSAELELFKKTGREPWIQPQRFHAVRLAAAPLSGILDQTAMEFTRDAEAVQVVLTLPTPDGRFETFEIVESPVMDPKLEAWMASQGWPIRTYRGISLDHPATSVRLDWGGPAGFHASVISPGRSYYIDPYWKGDRELYSSYFRSEFSKGDRDFRCLVEEGPNHWSGAKAGASTGGNLRTYRLVVAATGEYTAFHGGTAVAGQAAIVTTINRVNQVYERDLSIRMILVGNNMNVVYTNGATDPYTNGSGATMLGENQTNCDAVIGTANYDIGHVVSTGGGGIASLGVPCNVSFKARGVTGSSSPVGDPFDIDFVSHEIGHQWGGNHTFNSVTGSCSGNRSSTTAYEPGSGSTIQAYAGICGADDLQSNSDPYFHGVSLDEMLDYAAGGGACSVNISASNPNAPTVDAGASYTIPINTPFELAVASSDDLDGDSLTYTWEQFDLGPAATLAAGDTGSGPILRSWPPSADMFQLFPNNGVTPATGEILPTTNRTMNFRLTVRDNNPGGGRLGEDTTTVTSNTSAGPFLVTAPNGGELWDGTETVTWDVAGTAGGAVSTANVDILLSTDGGATFPTTLLSGTPNDGSQSVTLPDVDTSTARVKIMGSGNIFFDTSDGNFNIGTVASQTLVDQSTLCTGIGEPSQFFTDFGPGGQGTDVADDFGVPSGEQWTLGGVSVEGTFIGSGPLTSANVFVWSDSGGLPGAVVSGCSFLSQAPVGGLSDPDIEVNLPGTCVLGAGTYWIEVQAVMPFTPNGQWFWRRNTGTFGAEFAFFDEFDLFGIGCTTWASDSSCFDQAVTELCFTVSGAKASTGLIFEDGFESGDTTVWSNSVP